MSFGSRWFRTEATQPSGRSPRLAVGGAEEEAEKLREKIAPIQACEETKATRMFSRSEMEIQSDIQAQWRNGRGVLYRRRTRDSQSLGFCPFIGWRESDADRGFVWEEEEEDEDFLSFSLPLCCVVIPAP